MDECVHERGRALTRRFESTVYTSGDWYIRLFMMKYAASGRTANVHVGNDGETRQRLAHLLQGTVSLVSG